MHIAVSRSGTTTRCFINGQSIGTASDSSNYPNGRLTLGANYTDSNRLNAYVDEFCINRSATYTVSSFTPPSQAILGTSNTVLLLHFDGNFLDDTLALSDVVSKTFTKSNIIGPVTISGKGLNEFYNRVQFRYNNKDLADEADIVTVSVDSNELYPNEVTNTLNFGIDIVNDPVQAEYLASIELKQNRLDKIIQFDTDYSALGVKAGDIILMNISDFGNILQNAYYRVTEVEEQDADDGSIVLSITAICLLYTSDAADE